MLHCAEYLLAIGWEHKARGCDCGCLLGSRMLLGTGLNVRREKILKCLWCCGDGVAVVAAVSQAHGPSS